MSQDRVLGSFVSPQGQAFDLYARLLERRIVFCGRELDEAAANTVVAQLLHLDSEHPHSDIHLYVNSSGGPTAAVLAIYDTMECLHADVGTVCVGQAAGGAAVLLAAGAPGKRLALPHARVWVQHPHNQSSGAPADLNIRAREIIRERRLMEEVLARHTGQPVQRIGADTDRDFILTAEDARSYGIVDRVVHAGGLPHQRPYHAATGGC